MTPPSLLAQAAAGVEPNLNCAPVDGLYKNLGKQLSGTERGSKKPPTLAFDVLNTGRPGSSPTYIELKTENENKLLIMVLGPNKEVIHKWAPQAPCENGWLTFSSSASGGIEGYRGTTLRTVRLKKESQSKLIANVITDSKGRYFLVIPTADPTNQTYEFSVKE